MPGRSDTIGMAMARTSGQCTQSGPAAARLSTPVCGLAQNSDLGIRPEAGCMECYGNGAWGRRRWCNKTTRDDDAASSLLSRLRDLCRRSSNIRLFKRVRACSMQVGRDAAEILFVAFRYWVNTVLFDAKGCLSWMSKWTSRTADTHSRSQPGTR